MDQRLKNWSSGYGILRRADPAISRQIDRGLGRRHSRESVLNLGAGTGSYEPVGGLVVGCEPSAVMIAQRPSGLRTVQGVAEHLPFVDKSFDLGLAVLTTHHWSDLAAGLRELERVVKTRFVILTYFSDQAGPFWLTDDYLPSLGMEDDQRFAPLSAFLQLCSWRLTSVDVVLIGRECEDALLEAFWARPATYLDPGTKDATSSFWLGDPEELNEGLARLRSDLDSGRWDALYGPGLDEISRDFGYRLLVFEPPT